MCLGEVAEVLQLLPGPGALVRSEARTTTVSLLALDGTVAVGDWVVCHSGFALNRLTAQESHEATAIRGIHTEATSATAESTTKGEER